MIIVQEFLQLGNSRNKKIDRFLHIFLSFFTHTVCQFPEETGQTAKAVENSN